MDQLFSCVPKRRSSTKNKLDTTNKKSKKKDEKVESETDILEISETQKLEEENIEENPLVVNVKEKNIISKTSHDHENEESRVTSTELQGNASGYDPEIDQDHQLISIEYCENDTNDQEENANTSNDDKQLPNGNSKWLKVISFQKRRKSDALQDLENGDLDIDQYKKVLLKSTIFNYADLNVWLKKCSSEWLQQFLECNAMDVIFDALNSISTKKRESKF